MEKNKCLDVNDDMDWKCFVNDSTYPWDECYMMSSAEMDAIKRSLLSDTEIQIRGFNGINY
ncbi:MAG: hypothetical protein FWG09_08225 [Synergistaceae bacterium]|nr:hypothetical protein [Synergistaceae bacterium]